VALIFVEWISSFEGQKSSERGGKVRGLMGDKWMGSKIN
jgi:hypothetical protein